MFPLQERRSGSDPEMQVRCGAAASHASTLKCTSSCWAGHYSSPPSAAPCGAGLRDDGRRRGGGACRAAALGQHLVHSRDLQGPRMLSRLDLTRACSVDCPNPNAELHTLGSSVCSSALGFGQSTEQARALTIPAVSAAPKGRHASC